MAIEISPADQSIRDVAGAIVTEFFDKTGIDIRSWGPGPERAVVERRVRETLATWDLGDISVKRCEKYIIASINMAITTFGHNHVDTQTHIALYTVLGLIIDDLQIDSIALQEFVPRLYSDRRQLHPVLDYLVDNLQQLPEHFPPYTASAIFAATVQGVNSTWFDKQTENLGLSSDSLPYVLYKRARNSLGEVYGFYVWDKANFPDVTLHIQVIADTMTFLNYANDILSFYKEELAGETTNFVHDQALVTGKSVSEVLSGLLQEVVTAVERARVLLKGEKEKQTWERFIAGYVAYHFYSSRYRLVELTGTSYINPDVRL